MENIVLEKVMKDLKCIVNKLLIIFLISTVLSACGGAEERKAKYLEKGKEYIEEKNYKKARIELRNVLQIDPKHSEAWYLVGTIEEVDKNWRAAFGDYQKALALDPENSAAQVKLGYFYVLQGDVDNAKKMLNEILAIDPNNVEGGMLNVSILVKEEKIEKAIDAAKKIVKDHPDNVKAVKLLSSTYVKNKQEDKAIELLTKTAGRLKGNAEIKSQLARVYLKDKKFAEAEIILEEIIAIEPDEYRHRTNLAIVYTSLNKIDQAEQVLQKAVADQPEDLERIVQLVKFVARHRGLKQAKELFEKEVAKNEDSIELRFGLAEFNKNMGEIKDSKRIYEKIIKTQGDDKYGLRARNLLAKLFIKEGAYKKALEHIEHVLKENPQDNNALLSKGLYAINNNNPEMAINALRVVVRDQPASVVATSLLAKAHLLNNEPQLAREVLQRIIEVTRKNPKSIMNYARFLADENSYDDALAQIARVLNNSPKDIDALNLKAQIVIRKNDYVLAEKIYLDIKNIEPENNVHSETLGQFYLGRKQYKKAINEFETVLARSGKLLPSLAGIVKAYLAQSRFDEAKQRVKKALAKQPGNAVARELLAEVYIAQKNLKEAKLEVQKAIESNPKWSLPYTTLAKINFMQGDEEGEIRALQSGLGQSPGEPQLLLQIANAYQRNKNYEEAIKSYEKILNKNSRNVLAANNLASLLIDFKNDEKARERSKQLIGILKNQKQVGFRDTVGWVHYRTGDLEKALVILKDVVKTSPKVSVFNYHLGMVYYTQGKNEEAKKYLAIALESKNDFPGKQSAEKTLQSLK